MSPKVSFMKKVLWLVLLLAATSGAQELFTELQARVTPDGPLYTFRVLGEPDDGAFSAYGIHVIAPDGSEHMLDQFDSLLPEGSEIDALYVEDVNFDGFADLRIMKFLPGGANVPYYFWLYDKESKKFVEAKGFEVVLSPQVDSQNKELVSRQRVSAAEYVTEYFRPEGATPKLVRREERKFSPDGSSELKTFQVQSDGEMELVDTKKLGPEN
jgi:hypothetical protein